jgi:hypothetical protein
MNQRFAKVARALGVVAISAAPACYAEVDPDPAFYPPPSYVATVDPVFYDGHAVYWYGGHWAYRDGVGRWSYYRSEPAFLARRRGVAGPPRRPVYEHPADKRRM